MLAEASLYKMNDGELPYFQYLENDEKLRD